MTADLTGTAEEEDINIQWLNLQIFLLLYLIRPSISEFGTNRRGNQHDKMLCSIVLNIFTTHCEILHENGQWIFFCVLWFEETKTSGATGSSQLGIWGQIQHVWDIQKYTEAAWLHIWLLRKSGYNWTFSSSWTYLGEDVENVGRPL